MDGDDGGDNNKDRQPCDKDDGTTTTTTGKKIVNLCQLCLELENGRPPIIRDVEKEQHVIVHMRYTVACRHMSDEQIRRHVQFKKQMKICFEEGYYDEMKRNRPRTAMNLRHR